MKAPSILVVCAVCFWGASPTWAQSSSGFTFTQLAANSPYTTPVQAGDGNYYGAGQDPVSGNPSVYKMTPSGVFTTLYTFPIIDGLGTAPLYLVVGPDGRLYGTSFHDGTSGYGTVFALDLSGNLTTLYSFPGFPGCGDYDAWLTVGSDGNLYGPYQDTIFKITPSGMYSAFYAGLPSTPLNASACGRPLMQASDGNFYGVFPATGSSDGAFIYRLTSSGTFTTVYTFAFSGDDYPTSLTEAVDGNLYGSTKSILFFKITTAGAFTALNSLTSNSSIAANVLATDGNFYGGQSIPLSGPGSVDQFQPDGTRTTVFDFPNCSAYGAGPLVYSMIQGSDGNLYGVSVAGRDSCGSPEVLFRLTPPNPLPAPVQVSVTPSFVSIGQKTTLKWSVPEAINANYPICFASGNGGWSGRTPTSGSVTDSINAAGTYTFGLTCGGSESGTATLTVSKELASTVSLTATPNPVLAGNSVALTATAAPQGGSGPAATGTVNFYYQSDLLGSAAINNGTATFTASSAGIPPGSYAITAKYTGDANYAPATSSPVAVTVSAGYATTSTLAVTPNPVVQGNNATLTATVSDTNNGTIPGTVSFTSEGVVIGTAALSHNSITGANTATLSASTQGVPAGTYVVKAQYQGSGVYLPSTSTGVSEKVQDAAGARAR
jgi:uncharacterized repeat protein (TIGR03803 family)